MNTKKGNSKSNSSSNSKSNSMIYDSPSCHAVPNKRQSPENFMLNTSQNTAGDHLFLSRIISPVAGP